MKSMTIEKKLFMGVGTALVLTLVVGVVSWQSIGGLAANLNKVIDVNARKQFLASDMNTAFSGAPQRRRSPVGEGPTQGGCWLNLVASERPSWETGQGGASRQSPRKVGEQLCRP